MGEALATVLRIRIDLSLRRKGRVVSLLRESASAPQPSPGGYKSPIHDGGMHSTPLPIEVAASIWAVRHAARLVPAASCLTQAIAGQTLLLRRGLVSIVRLGVRRGESGAFEAHAWLIYDGQTVLGGSFEPGPDFVPLSDLTPIAR